MSYVLCPCPCNNCLLLPICDVKIEICRSLNTLDEFDQYKIKSGYIMNNIPCKDCLMFPMCKGKVNNSKNKIDKLKYELGTFPAHKIIRECDCRELGSMLKTKKISMNS